MSTRIEAFIDITLLKLTQTHVLPCVIVEGVVCIYFLLVLKLLVSSHPLILEGVLCIYVLLLHEGQAEFHFAMFFYMLKTHT
jgi:hypothetical protein